MFFVSLSYHKRLFYFCLCHYLFWLRSVNGLVHRSFRIKLAHLRLLLLLWDQRHWSSKVLFTKEIFNFVRSLYTLSKV